MEYKINVYDDFANQYADFPYRGMTREGVRVHFYQHEVLNVQSDFLVAYFLDKLTERSYSWFVNHLQNTRYNT